VNLLLFHDNPISQSYYSRFDNERVMVCLRALDKLARTSGLQALDPVSDPLVRIGTELESSGQVTKSFYGLLNLAWQVDEHPEWAAGITQEVEEIREQVRIAHHSRVRFVIWVGMGGLCQDKAMYNAVGLLKRSPRCYVLDSTDPAKLKRILEDMESKSGLRLPDALRSTLVFGMAMGITSPEPFLNFEKLAALYDKFKIDGTANFYSMALPGSLIDKFARKRGYPRIELQPDGENSTAGPHTGPLTRGSLYPLALSRVELGPWMDGAALEPQQIETAWRLAAFLHAQAAAGRGKVTMVLPRPWAGAGPWTKQNFERSLGQSKEHGIKIILEDRIKLANYRSPKDPGQDRTFLALKVRGFPVEKPDKVGMLRRSGYPLASLTLPKGTQLSTYMQFIHYTVFGVAYLRDVNFVTQPGVELHRKITGRLFREAEKAGGVDKCKEWKKTASSPRRVKHRGCITLAYDRLALELNEPPPDAPSTYAAIIKKLLAEDRIDHAELTFFGDTRYSPNGRTLLQILNRSAERLFRFKLKMPVDIGEGPAMNHSLQEMAMGHGRCLSTVIISEKQEKLAAARYNAQYHVAQFLATQMAFEQWKRPVVSITLKDLEEGSLTSLEDLFRQAATSLKSIRV
jgi:hypothetical protein